MKKLIMSILFVTLLFTFTSGQAMAAVATGSATVDWNAITFTNANYSYNLTASTSAATYAGFPVQVTTASDSDSGNYNGSSTIQSSASGTQASASASVVNYLNTVSVQAGPTGSAFPAAKSEVTAIISVTAIADGAVVINIPYTFTYTIDASTAGDIYAQLVTLSMAPTLTHFIAGGGQPATTSGIEQKISPLVMYDDIDTYNVLKTYTVTLNDFKAGDTGTFEIKLTAHSAAAAVPVPAAIWLLGSGFIGLIGIRRRRSTK